jgi:hypothetical protein
MVITKENLTDIIAYYMQDHDIDYVSIRASQSIDRSEIIMVINDDLEYDDE